jgi:hypothetical protein
MVCPLLACLLCLLAGWCPQGSISSWLPQFTPQGISFLSFLLAVSALPPYHSPQLEVCDVRHVSVAAGVHASTLVSKLLREGGGPATNAVHAMHAAPVGRICQHHVVLANVHTVPHLLSRRSGQRRSMAVTAVIGLLYAAAHSTAGEFYTATQLSLRQLSQNMHPPIPCSHRATPRFVVGTISHQAIKQKKEEDGKLICIPEPMCTPVSCCASPAVVP